MNVIRMDQKAIVEGLKKQSRLSTWPANELEKLAAEIEVLKVEKGETIFSARTQSDDAYIVQEGRVRQSVKNDQGVEWWYRTRGPYDIFVQQALFRKEGHPSTAVAESEVLLFRIHAAVLAQLMTKHPELWALVQHDTPPRLQSIPLLRVLTDEEIDRLSVSTEVKEFASGQQICKPNDPDGALWIVDWGQVRITEQAQMDLQGGRLGASTASRDMQSGQGFQKLPQILTAGNWFVGGLVNIPHQLAVGAEALTQVKLLRIPAHLLESLETNFEDIHYQLRHRLNIVERLRSALANDPYFRPLGSEHYESLATVTGWEHVPAGLDVSRQGEQGDKLYVLATGEARVQSTDETGRERPRHYMKADGLNYYGLNSMLKGERRDATVRSVTSDAPPGAGRLDPEPVAATAALAAQPPQQPKPVIDGSDWLSVQREDLRYLMQSQPALWKDTALHRDLMQKAETKRFDWQEDQEEIELVTRRHPVWLWLRLLAVAGILAGVFGIMLALDALGRERVFSPATFVLVGLVVSFAPLLWFIVDYYNDYYVITTRRVLRRDQVLFIYQTQLEAPLERIQDITLTTSLLAKILNYGRLDIRTAGLGGDIAFNMVPRPDKVEDIIRSLQRQTQASARAVQRESLRNKLLSGLKMRLIPQAPPRVLPAGTAAPTPVTGLEALFAPITRPGSRFFRWLRSLRGKIRVAYAWLLPPHAREQVLKEHQARMKKKAAERADRIVYRKHIFFLIRTAAIPIVLMIATLLLVLVFPMTRELIAKGPSWLKFGVLVWLLICGFWLWFFYENWRNDQYILTKTHVIDITALPLGLFEQRRQAEWDKIQNANYEMPTFWANLFNFGTVTLQTAAVMGGKLDFLHVPNPRRVQQEVFQHMEAARQAKVAKDIAQQQQTLSETLEVYSELQREWNERQQNGSAGPFGGTRTGLS